jgi:hypothetical protein
MATRPTPDLGGLGGPQQGREQHGAFAVEEGRQIRQGRGRVRQIFEGLEAGDQVESTGWSIPEGVAERIVGHRMRPAMLS